MHATLRATMRPFRYRALFTPLFPHLQALQLALEEGHEDGLRAAAAAAAPVQPFVAPLLSRAEWRLREAAEAERRASVVAEADAARRVAEAMAAAAAGVEAA